MINSMNTLGFNPNKIKDNEILCIFVGYTLY